LDFHPIYKSRIKVFIYFFYFLIGIRNWANQEIVRHIRATETVPWAALLWYIIIIIIKHGEDFGPKPVPLTLRVQNIQTYQT